MTPTNDERKETFYPGVLKRCHLAGFLPLANAQGFRRCKLTITIAHNDGQLTGIPDWIAEPLKLVQKANSGSKTWRGEVEIDGLKLSSYATDQSEKPNFEVVSAVANSFAIVRTSKESPKGDKLADAELSFSMYVDYSDGVWDWAKETSHRDFFARFGTGQASFSFGKPAKVEDDGQGKELPTEETEEQRLERERREATSAAQDHLFDPKAAAAGEGKTEQLTDALVELVGVDPRKVHEFTADESDDPDCSFCGEGVLAEIHNTERYAVGTELPNGDGITDDDHEDELPEFADGDSLSSTGELLPTEDFDNLEDEEPEPGEVEAYNATVEVEDDGGGITDEEHEPESHPEDESQETPSNDVEKQEAPKDNVIAFGATRGGKTAAVKKLAAKKAPAKRAGTRKAK